MRKLSSPAAWGIFFFLSFVWGSSFILMKRGLEAFSPLQIGALRMLIGGGVLLPFILGRLRGLPRKSWGYIALVGACGNGIPAFLFPLAETRLSSASTGILNSLSPLFVLILGTLWFQTPILRTQLWGVLIGFAGAILLIAGAGGGTDLLQQLPYALLVILATVGYGLSTNLMKHRLNDTHPMLASGLGLAMASIPYALYLALFSKIGAAFEADAALAWRSLGYIFLLGAIGSGLSLVLFYRLVQGTSALFSASVTYLIPVGALAWGLLDGESFYPLQGLGLALILTGLYILRLPPRKALPALSSSS
jgi:drug/metabolite transporter (DMT)-like permease